MPDRKTFLTIILTLIFAYVNGQNYSAGLIPDSLKENANAVIREYVKEFELQGVSKGKERIRTIITVLDNNGDEYGNLNIPYDKDSKVSIYEAVLYDKYGKKVKKISQSDISDNPSQDGGTLYSDNRVKSYRPIWGDYPYTLEYEFEISYSNLISYGRWTPLYGYNISLEHSKLTFIHPSEVQYKKKEINLQNKSVQEFQGNKIVERWECKSLKAIEYEPFGVYLRERVPNVFLMPVNLVYEEYTGTANNWKEYGKWINGLYSGRDEVSEAEKIKIVKILQNVQDTIQKIKLLYEYMQEHTRYVGIQLGIGGLQPFPALTVFETGYGDCKALTNYMHSLLKLSGIKSYPALVSSGVYIEPIYTDFPNFQQFDHVILCIPRQSDTIWLECTNQNIPFGFLGDFTDDRDVLLITEDGGKLVHTKKYSAADNVLISIGEFIIDPAGNANCTIKNRYQGLEYYDIFSVLNSSSDEQKKWLYRNSNLPSPQFINFSIENNKESIPSAKIDQSCTSKNYCSFTGNYMLVPMNLINIQPPVKKIMKERKSDFIIHRSSTEYDTLVYKIPAGYKIESLPEGKTISSLFGDYSYTVSLKNNNIVYTRKYAVHQGRFRAGDYKSFYEFFLAVSKADNVKVMLTK